MTVEIAYKYLFRIGLTVIGVCLAMTVLKSIIGPRISDRIMTINMVGTLVVSAIAILSSLLSGEEYLIDVCIIYVLISFLSVVVLTGVYINEYIRKEKNKSDKKDDKK